MFCIFCQSAFAACGGTVRTWAGSNNNWTTASNWSAANVPDSASEDAVIVNSGQRARMTGNLTVGCVDVQSGTFEGTQNRTITVVGDYFKAPNPNSLRITNNAFEIEMAGTSAQTFEVVDDIRDLTINNTSTVTLTDSFRILSDFNISSSGTTIVEGDLTLNNTGVVQSIPAGHTLIIRNGGSLFARGGLTVDGVLQIEAGGELRIQRNETLTVSNGGVLKLLGSSGNPARVVSEASNRNFVFNMNGTLIASYFLIQRTSDGVNVGGTISQLENGEFRGIRNNRYGIVLGAASSIPATMDSIGFFNDDSVANPFNIDASAYNNGVSTLDNYTGDVGGTAFENDPNNQLTWTAPAATELAITNDAEAGEPQNMMDPNDEFTFAEFAFSLTQNDTATNITSVNIAMTGTASISDLDYVRAYLDDNGNCNFQNGETQIGGDLVFTGSPPTATVTISPGDVQTNGPSNLACISIVARAGANPQDQKTVKFAVQSTSDVTNSQGYSFSTTSGPPLETAQSIIRNQNFSSWDGTSSTSWNVGANWTGAIPSSNRDCQIGVGASDTAIDSNPVACANATLLANGVIDWGNTSNVFEVYSNLEIQSPYTFSNAANGIFSMVGNATQSLSMATAFPGSVIVNNTGTAGNDIIRVDSDSTINGNLTCTQGEIAIPDGVTLTVLGDVTVQTGCTLSIEAGGVLALGGGSTVTVDSGGTLSMLGSAGSKAKMMSTSTSNAFNVIVNGTIAAQFYTFERLATSGVSIESGAIIDATYHLQDGTFSYPVNSATTFLSLKRQVPTNTMDNMFFDTDGSGSGSITAVNTTGAGAGTLTITGYSGDSSGPGFDTSPTYNVAWAGATNTIAFTRESTSPTTVTVGSVYTMGRYGLKQSQAGASYSDSNVTSIKLTLTGTGTANDIQEVKIYSNSTCSGSGGTLIGTGVFTGSPASKTFTITPGDLVVEADLTATVKTCFYVDYEIASGATNGNTVGVQVTLATDIANSETYSLIPISGFPVTLGTSSTIDAPTTTTWTGTANTSWTNTSNWTAGVPDLNKTCEIPNVANDPIISTGVATCKNINITNGILTLNAAATLETYGNFTSKGSFNQSGTLEIEDGGSSLTHSITTNATLANLHINKTGGGTITLASTTQTINSLVVNGTNYTLLLDSGKTLILPNGASIPSGLWQFKSGSFVQIGNGQTLLVNGGTFFIQGSSDVFPQSTASKAKFSPQGGAGSWNFTSTSGTLSINGFHFDRLGTNGINIGGTTSVTLLSGGQLTNLSTSYSSVKGIQLNTTGSLPLQMANIAWNWGDFNSFDPANPNTPANTENYQIISSTGCAAQTVDFTGWSGDWFEATQTFDVTTKVSASGCTINMGSSASAVSMHSLAAVPYNSKVDIRWETNTEQNHRGFNVYRSNADASEFQQINPTIIKNIFNAGQSKGKYRFVDADVSNDMTYYYYVEDVEVDGDTTLHGPVLATPLATLGNPPATDPGQNDGSNPDDGDDGGGMGPFPIPNPSYKDLGNGAAILSQTSRSMRIEIIPGTPLFSDSAWDITYEDVAIQGYSKATEEGKAELAERVLLIEVNKFAEAASLTNMVVNESLLANHKISPAPTYVIDGSGNLQPQYLVNSAYYSTNNFMPSSYVDLNSNLIKNAGKTYLSIKIKPLKFNPVTEEIHFSNKIVLDIGLDGDAWDIDPPEPGSIINPYNIANTLKIAYDKAGVYQLSYDDLVSSEVNGPFINADTSNLRLYLGTEEIPLEVSSAGTFTSGDYIRFYVPFEKSLEDKYNRLILSTVNISEYNDAPLRIQNLDGDPTGQQDSSESLTIFNKTYEENLLYVDGESLDDSEDHFLWAGLLNYTGYDTLSFNIDMDELDTNSYDNVRLNFHVKGRLGIFFNYSIHHVALNVNGQEVDDRVFEENNRQVLTFEVPADEFIAGTNSISFKVLGTYAPSGDYDRVFVDKMDLEYIGYRDGGTGASEISIAETMSVHKIEGFSSANLSIYDTTDHLQTGKIINSEILTFDAGSTYQTRFYVDDFVSDEDEKRVTIIQDNNFLKPTGLSLNDGAPQSLKDTNNRADYIIIGHKNLLEAASEIVAHREADGLEVMTLTPAQIFGEFNKGNTSSQAIRDFIDYALASWQVKPRYLLMLGDATVDPLNHDVDDNGNDRSVLDTETLPIPILDGRFIDFGADNYYVSSSASHIPRIAIGRLPTNKPSEVYQYGQKLIDYESKATQPYGTNLKKMAFVADEEQEDYENFRQKIDILAETVTKFSNVIYDKAEIGSDAGTKSAIINEFNQAPYMMTLMGHGAADRFSTNTFLVADAGELSLTNNQLPIVMTLNCESAYFFDATKSMKSLGEALVLNPVGGSIAYLGSTTQTTPPAQMRLGQNFLSIFNTSLASPYKGQRLGDYFLQAKIATGTAEYEKDIVNSFSIIGDPALRIPSELYTPEVAAPPAPISQGGSGCSANASDGSGSQIPWTHGALEWLCYFLMIAFANRVSKKYLWS